MSLLLLPTSSVCKNLRTIGGNRNVLRADDTFDGEWRVCWDHIPRNCVVYSFGVGWDWSFDDVMTRHCTVYSFDPSMDLPAHTRSSGVHFFPYALGPVDATVSEPVERSWRQNKTMPATWVQRSLASIKRELGHTTVDIVKVDIEGGEWDVLRDVFLHARHQLLMEVHFGDRSVLRHLKALRRLTRDFQLFSSVRNLNAGNAGHSIFSRLELRNTCFELSFLRNRLGPS